jgi:hypothetical protein
VGSQQLIVPPLAEPLSLVDAKAQLRLDADQTADDMLIGAYVTAARIHVENLIRRQIVMATFRLTLDRFPWRVPAYSGVYGDPRAVPIPHFDVGRIVLPSPPLQQVTRVAYVDAGGAAQTMDPALYFVDDQAEPARVMSAAGTSWPSTLGQINSLSITYTAGWMVPFAVDATADTVTPAGRPRANGDGVRLYLAGASLPGGLAAGLTYYVVNAGANSCQLSLTAGGSAVNITDAGIGYFFLDATPEPVRQAIRLALSFFYDNRGDMEAVPPEAIETLLSSYNIWSF